MEWYTVLCILIIVAWTTFVLTINFISYRRGINAYKSSCKYVLYKTKEKTYNLVKKDNYMPVHDMILESDILISLKNCKNVNEVLKTLELLDFAKEEEIYNATGEEI